MVCGFCSTGCSLDVHLRDGEAVNLTPDDRLSGEPGHGLPEGLGGADAAARRRPRDDAAAARRQRPARSRSTGTRRSRRSSTRFKAIHDEHGPESVAFLSTGPDPDRGDGAARRAGQVRHGHGARRRQHAAVHGHVGRRLQAVVRLRRAAVHLRRLRGVRRASCSSARTCASPTRSCGSASAATRTSPRSSSIDPRATETAMAATQHLRAAPEVATSRCSTASRTCSIARRLDRPRVHRRAHRPASTSSPRTSAAFTPERVAPSDRARASTQLERARRHDPRGQARVVLVDDGRQPEPRGRAHRAGDHQPGADDRQHRPARHRRQLDHRPVQRDGLAAVQQHHQPARRPRLHQRRRTAPKVAGVLGIDAARIPDRAEPGLRPDHRRRSLDGKIKGLWVIATNPAHSWINQTHAARRARPARVPRRAGHVPHDRDRAAAPTSCCPPPAGARRKARSSTPSGASALIKKVAPRARARRWPTSHIFKLIAEAWGCGEMFARVDDRPRRCSSILKRLSRRPAVRHHRHRRLRRCSTTRGGMQWPLPEGDDRRAGERAAAVRGRPLLPPRRPGAVPVRRAARRCPSRRRRALPARAAHRPRQLEPVAHADPHREVGRAAVAGSDRGLRRALARRRRALGQWARATGSRWSRSAAPSGPGRASRRRSAPGRCSCRCTTPATNRLTHAAFDPHSRQPSYKSGAVEVRRARRQRP